MNQVRNAVGDGLAIGERKKGIHVDSGLLSFGLPVPSIVLTGATELLLLTVHRNERLALPLKLLRGLIDMLELRIPIRG